VHALFAALSRATGLQLEVDHYQVSSVTTGDDAQGQARVTARHGGTEYIGSGTSTDIVEASALAWLDIANRVYRSQRHDPAKHRLPEVANA
jgi:2-isopropylmalate synthase